MSLRNRLALNIGAIRAIVPVRATELTGMRLTPAPVFFFPVSHSGLTLSAWT